MLNDKISCDIQELKGKLSIYQAQEFLESMPYDYETADAKGKYIVRSPKLALERGSIMCIDGALLGAALTGIRPKIMGLHFKKRSHAILITEDEKSGLYGAIAKSRNPDWEFREQIFGSKEDLAKSYEPTLAYDIIHADSQVNDWMTNEGDLSELLIYPKAKRTRSFSIHYFLNPFFIDRTV